jgi:hypothetical protein
MQESPTGEGAADVVFCTRHPNVETGLKCGRCETPICPKCVVFTDVGARCPECAPRRKLPQFELSPGLIARALGAGALAGTVVGVAWGILLPGGFGFFSIFLGVGVGWAVSEPVSLATNRKSGPVLQAIAAGGVVLAYLAHNLAQGEAPIVPGDITGFIVLGVGAITAVGRLRF